MHKFPEPMAKFPVSVPIDLKRRFKAKCASEGVLTSEAIRGLLSQACADDAPASSKLKPAAKPAERATA